VPEQAAAEPLVVLSKVNLRYPAVASSVVTPWVLHELDLTLQRGEGVAIMGPSGSGKSSLLHLIGGLDKPTAGTVRVAGHDLASLHDQELSAFRSLTVGFIFQDHHLLPQLSVLENVLLPALAVRHSSTSSLDKGRAQAAVRAAHTRAPELLREVGLGERLHHRPSQLSGGERQRVAVVRALINEPRLVLADEPTGALDQVTAAALAELLVGLHQTTGVALVVVTHSPEIAARLPRTLQLVDGKLVDQRGGA